MRKPDKSDWIERRHPFFDLWLLYVFLAVLLLFQWLVPIFTRQPYLARRGTAGDIPAVFFRPLLIMFGMFRAGALYAKDSERAGRKSGLLYRPPKRGGRTPTAEGG